MFRRSTTVDWWWRLLLSFQLSSSPSSASTWVATCYMLSRQGHSKFKIRQKEASKSFKNIQTLPEAQRTQGIASLTWVISPANKKNATCIGSKFGHQVAPLASVTNLATRWRHLHYLQIWPPDGDICISCKIAHQMTPLALGGIICIVCNGGHQLA